MKIPKCRYHDFDTHYDRDDDSNYDDISIPKKIHEDGDASNKSSYISSNNVRDINLLYDVKTVQQHNFVCDNIRYYPNNNNANSIEDIGATILEVRMKGMFYIPVKKKYILYLLKLRKKRSFHTSKHQNIPYIIQDIIQISSNEESSTVQYSKRCNCVRNDDFGTHYDHYIPNMVPNNQICSQNDDFDTNYDQYCDQDDDDQDHTIIIVNEFDTTCTTMCSTMCFTMCSTTCTTACTTTADKPCTTTDSGTHYDQNMVPTSRNCVRNNDFDTHYDRYCDHDDDQDHPINDCHANLVTHSRICSRNYDFDPHYDQNYAWDDDINNFDTHYD